MYSLVTNPYCADQEEDSTEMAPFPCLSLELDLWSKRGQLHHDGYGIRLDSRSHPTGVECDCWQRHCGCCENYQSLVTMIVFDAVETLTIAVEQICICQGSASEFPIYHPVALG